MSKSFDMAFKGTLMIPGLTLIILLEVFVILGAENILGYIGLAIYTMLTFITLVRKYKELS